MEMSNMDVEKNNVMKEEGDLGGRKIELKNEEEELIIKRIGIVEIGKERIKKGFKSLGIVKKKDLDIGKIKKGILDMRKKLRKGGDIKEGEDIFEDERIGRERKVWKKDGVKKEKEVRINKKRKMMEVLGKMKEEEMLKNEERKKKVEIVIDIEVVGKIEFWNVRKKLIEREMIGDGVMLIR